MAQFPSLTIWTDALIADTSHLSPTEFGAYVRLLICAWRRPNCDLPFDDVFLGRCIGDTKNWHRIKPRVLPFFTIQEDSGVSCGRTLRQKRLLRERTFASERAARASAGGIASSLKRQKMASTTLHSSTTPNEQRAGNPLTHTHTLKKEGNGEKTQNWTGRKEGYREGYKAGPDTPEFKAWKDWAFAHNTALWRELMKRELEGRAFDFETKLP